MSYQEIKIKEFLDNLNKAGYNLNTLRLCKSFTKPTIKVNFQYNYFYYLIGIIYITRHCTVFANSRISIAMLDGICNLNDNDYMIITSEQYETYKSMIKKNI